MSVSSLPAYKHRPLSLNLDEQPLRLLKVQYQTDASEPIHLHLEEFDLRQSSLEFKALSYTWGPVAPCSVIVINGHSLVIRDNLYHFLSTVRAGQEFCNNTWLWIDQICIDQSSVTEKNHQVNQMSKIYRAAHEVIIWLGLSFLDSDCVVEAIRRHIPLERYFKSVKAKEKLRSGINRLNALDYWQRTWIRQEVILAQQLVVFLGSSVFSWDSLMVFAERKTRIGLGNLTDITSLHSYRQGHREGNGMDWEEALVATQSTECADVHDIAYSMLGLVYPDLIVEVNYSSTLHELCLGIATARTSANRKLDAACLQTHMRTARWCCVVFQLSPTGCAMLRTEVLKCIMNWWYLERASRNSISQDSSRSNQHTSQISAQQEFIRLFDWVDGWSAYFCHHYWVKVVFPSIPSEDFQHMQ